MERSGYHSSAIWPLGSLLKKTSALPVKNKKIESTEVRKLLLKINTSEICLKTRFCLRVTLAKHEASVAPKMTWLEMTWLEMPTRFYQEFGNLSSGNHENVVVKLERFTRVLREEQNQHTIKFTCHFHTSVQRRGWNEDLSTRDSSPCGKRFSYKRLTVPIWTSLERLFRL